MGVNQVELNQEMLITIKRIGINGEGIGYFRRQAIFVDGALPGEEVVVRISEIYDDYARAQIVRIKKRSPDRVEAFCTNADKCGACQLKHLSYPGQLRAKMELIAEAFSRYYDGNTGNIELYDIIGMDNPYHYRNKTKLPVRYDGEKLVTGLYAINTNRLVYVDECMIEKEDIRKCVREVCAYLTKYQVIAYSPKSNEGVLSHIVVRSSSATKEIQVTLILVKEDKRTINIAKDLINLENVKSVYISINSDIKNLETFGEKTYLIAGEPTITEKLGILTFHLLPTSFFQLNSVQTEKLYNLVLENADLKGTENVLDGYCGVGTIGLWLAPYAKEVRGIDNNEEAITNANDNAKLNNLSNASFYYGNLLPHLHKFKEQGFIPDVFVVDPPRTGLDLKLIQYLQDYPVKKLIYVSCNPATLVKNLNHLKSKYKIISVHPVDMFPQTAHVETVVLLERK